MAVALAAALVLALALPGGETHTRAELALQRSHLSLVSRELLRLEAPVQREVAAARAAWPALAQGMPAHVSARLASETAVATASAEAMPAPAFLTARHELLGPAARIAALFHDFELLVQRGWSHTNQTAGSLRHGPATVAAFERSNAGLYIDGIYDGNFDVSLIGERVLHSYERLGGAHAFGKSLTPTEVSSLAAAYSPQTDRLVPHLWRALLAQS